MPISDNKKNIVEVYEKAPELSQNKITPLPHQRVQKRKFETKSSSQLEFLEDDISKENEIENTNKSLNESLKQDKNKVDQINKYTYPKIFKKAKQTDDNGETKRVNHQIIQINLNKKLIEIENEQMEANSIAKNKDKGTTKMDDISCKLDKLYEYQDILEEFKTPNEKSTTNIPEFLRKDKDNSLHNLIAKFIGTSSSPSHTSTQEHQMSFEINNNGATNNPSIDMILNPTPTDIYLNDTPDDRFCDKSDMKSFDNDIIPDLQTNSKMLKVNDITNNHASIDMKQSIKTKHFKKVTHFTLSQKIQVENSENMAVPSSKPLIQNPNATFIIKPNALSSNVQINPGTLAKEAGFIRQKVQNKEVAEQIPKGSEDFLRGTHRKKAEREALNGYQCDQCEKVILIMDYFDSNSN